MPNLSKILVVEDNPLLLLDLWERLAGPCEEPAMFDDFPSFPTQTVAEDLATLLEVVQADGTAQVIAVDLTDPALGVPVVKVLVPGRATDVEAMG